MKSALPIETKMERIETLFNVSRAKGFLPGTILGRVLMPEEEGGGVGWCLSIGRLDMPKCHFRAKTINGCFAKARNAATKGKISPPEIPFHLF